MNLIKELTGHKFDNTVDLLEIAVTMGSAKEVGKLNQKAMSEAKGKLKNALGKAKQFGSNVSREVRELKNSARAFCRREVAKLYRPRYALAGGIPVDARTLAEEFGRENRIARKISRAERKVPRQIKKSTRVPGSSIDEKFAEVQYKKRIDQTPLGVGEKARGFWTGERGESVFIPNKPEIKELLKKYNLEGIPYKNGEVDFSFAAEHQVTISGMAGGTTGPSGRQARKFNFSSADSELSKKLGVPKEEIISYRKLNKLTWHECNDMKTMQLVPTRINEFFGHTGGVGEINLLFDLLEGNLN